MRFYNFKLKFNLFSLIILHERRSKNFIYDFSHSLIIQNNIIYASFIYTLYQNFIFKF